MVKVSQSLAAITGLTPNTTYYVRAYATNIFGTGYGNQITFNSSDYPNCGTVTDVDGNLYKTVTIGNQCWLRENLKTTKFRNGDPIPNVPGDATWATLTSGAQCVYNNDINNSTVYGRLYNSYAVNDSRNIAPIGWHVPSDAEWTALTTYLGGTTVAGKKLKENIVFPATSHWFNGGAGAIDATNESGFTAVGGGYRYSNGKFLDMVYNGYWMTSTGQARSMAYNNSNVSYAGGSKEGGYSIRCVKD